MAPVRHATGPKQRLHVLWSYQRYDPARKIRPNPSRACNTVGSPPPRRTETSYAVLVFTFPGQGSQRSGMGGPWVDHPSWEFVGEASEAAGRDLAYLLLEAPIDELTRTDNAQLATTVLSLVVLDAVERLGLTPAACAGHSLGEYTALVASGGLTFEHGIQLVVARGEAMARAGEEAPGTMAALLGISDDDAEAACMRAEGDVWVANYNAPGQVVIAGTHEAVAVASELAKELGARRVMPIPVSGAFHTPLMQGARGPLRKALAEVNVLTPEVRVVANVDARVHDDPADWPGLLSAQLCSPVRWRQTLETFAGLGLTSLIELGPGGVLSGLAKRSLPEIQSLAVAKPADLDTLMDQVAEAGTWKAEPALHQGEHLYMSERVVVSPSSGVFAPEESLRAPGAGLLPGTEGGPEDDAVSVLAVGDLVGQVGDTEVRTPFSGQVIGWLAAAGERVQDGQPLVWMRVPDRS
ncbi:MAG: acyltransferase domain-containing protein [Acidimicrobiales bacterium]